MWAAIDRPRLALRSKSEDRREWIQEWRERTKGASTARAARPEPPSEAEKQAIFAVCEAFISDVLKPRFLPQVRPTEWNYVIDIHGARVAWPAGCRSQPCIHALARLSLKLSANCAEKPGSKALSGLQRLIARNPQDCFQTDQTDCHDEFGRTMACAGSGQDAAFRAGAHWPKPRFEARDEVVLDRLTGLVWTRDVNLEGWPMFWDEALEYVARMNRDRALGFADWRLPKPAGVAQPRQPSDPEAGLAGGASLRQCR